jgi:hypothetical protein
METTEGGFSLVLHSHDRSLGIDHAKISDSVNRHWHVIACHDFLARDVDGHDAQIHFHHAVDDRDEENHSRVSLAHHLGNADRGKGDASHDVRQNPGSDEREDALKQLQPWLG